MMIETNDISRGETQTMTRLMDKFKCLIEAFRIKFDPYFLNICTVPSNMLLDQNGDELNKRAIHPNETVRRLHSNSVASLNLLEMAAEIDV